MSRAINMTLTPSNSINAGATVEAYTYAPGEVAYDAMAENVYLAVSSGVVRCNLRMTPDEARELASHLLEIAKTAEEHRAARMAEQERQESFDEICEEMRDSEDRGGSFCYYCHPDIHYVPAEQIESKVREMMAAGVERFMVLPEPMFDEVA